MAGFFGNSYALIADAIESTTDIFASFLVLFGIKYSNRPADKTTHMATVVQPLITFIVVGFLITSATIGL
jgi:divalent metal cation (Fe/Co/Zn/Cd) transporter